MDYSFELIDDKTLRIIENGCIIEIPIKLLDDSNWSEKDIDCTMYCSFSDSCFNNYSNSYPCAQLYGILKDDERYEDLLEDKELIFDVAEVNSKVAGKIIVRVMNNSSGIIKKKIIFKRRTK